MKSVWNEQQQEIRDFYEQVALKRVRPSAAARDVTLTFDRQIWRDLGASGLFGLHMPEEFGGRGLGLREFAAALEGFSRGSQDMGVLVSFVAQVGLVQAGLLSYGTEEQKQRWLPGLIRGELLGSFAITEQGCGSDVRAMKLAASQELDGFRINGQKWNITNAPQADVVMTFAHVEGAGEKSVTCFITGTDVPGLERSEPFELLGNRGTPIGAFNFNNVLLPESAVVGGVGGGLNVLYFAFLVERVLTGLVITGCMEPLMEDCLRYSQERMAFGRPIGDNQYIQGQIVEMYCQIEVLRSVLLRAMDSMEQGVDCSSLASLVKMIATESLHEACINAIRIHGNSGYRRDKYFERLLRDSIGVFFAGGTIEIHRHVIWTNLVEGFRRGEQAREGLNLGVYQHQNQNPATAFSKPREEAFA
ncbi:MAG: acyl-CoA/acyl-ACP dehydrogenase [Saccharospirillaceae bacterium]|nr:acyl-CoA/acyl-ACP dehydrogenase [Saccharospirillaceae bacterium]MCD8531539.1 acyl-CoA/acyl-ACP dehydrogenase [Saccharospirillaceae bacterium]